VAQTGTRAKPMAHGYPDRKVGGERKRKRERERECVNDSEEISLEMSETKENKRAAK
jgi:hypothetical protein